ncbi:MAG: hypothetical protein IIY21_22120 [Clostridiales bacterium]|nr:hypothetical protein [Clostridiales bacterium]
MENKQRICDAFCATIRMTSNGGRGNALKELRYIPEGNGHYSEVVRPIFEDGTGEDGYYDVNVACDSGTALIMDITNQFVRRMW